MTNPDATEHDLYGQLTPLSDMLEYSSEHHYRPIIQVPTIRYRDNVALGAEHFRTFLEQLNSGEFGEFEDIIIEIGNEFDVVHQPLVDEIGWGHLSAEKYGEIAVEFVREYSEMNIEGVEIAVQGAFNLSDNRTVIGMFRNTGLAAEIGYISVHAYPSNLETIGQRVALRAKRVDRWEAEFNQDYGFFLSEWNIKSYGDIYEHPDNAWGLRQAYGMVEFVYQLALNGVDIANVWTQQQATVASLAWVEGTGEIRIGGHAYRMLSGSLMDAVAIDTGNTIDDNVVFRVFETANTYVVFITAFDVNNPITVSILSEAFQVDTDSAWVEILTSSAPDDSPTGDAIAIKSHSVNLEDGMVSTTINVPNELHKIVFSKQNMITEFWGTDADDKIAGSKFSDTLYGDSGADTFYLKGGNDYSKGGSGRDYIDAGTGDDTVFGGRDGDLIFGRLGNDYLEGGGGSDRLFGGAGNDILFGGLGSDVLRGGYGSDFIVGGKGNDALRGSFGSDTFVFSNADDINHIWDFEIGVDTILLIEGSYDEVVHYVENEHTVIEFKDTVIHLESATYDIDIDSILQFGTKKELLIQQVKFEHEMVETGQYSVYREDFLYETILGSTDSDTLVADQRYSQVLGRAGDDVIYGGGHGDILKGGSGNDSIWGESGDDRIYGGRGDDYLSGGLGDDYIFAAAGNDTLIGGEGFDTFEFGLGRGHNIIYDYNGMEDAIIFNFETTNMHRILQRIDDTGSLIIELDELFSIELRGYGYEIEFS